MNTDLVTIDPETLGGTPVFRGTRVPVKSLFDYLQANYTLEQFLECFPTVTREFARQVLEQSGRALLCQFSLSRYPPGEGRGEGDLVLR